MDSAELIRYGLPPTGRARKVTKKKADEAAAKSEETGKVDIEVAPV